MASSSEAPSPALSPAPSPEPELAKLRRKVEKLERELRSCRRQVREIEKLLHHTERLYHSAESNNRELRTQVRAAPPESEDPPGTPRPHPRSKGLRGWRELGREALGAAPGLGAPCGGVKSSRSSAPERGGPCFFLCKGPLEPLQGPRNKPNELSRFSPELEPCAWNSGLQPV